MKRTGTGTAMSDRQGKRLAFKDLKTEVKIVCNAERQLPLLCLMRMIQGQAYMNVAKMPPCRCNSDIQRLLWSS